MSSGLIIALEAGFVLGGLIAFALWEIFSLRREKRRDEAAKHDEEKPV